MGTVEVWQLFKVNQRNLEGIFGTNFLNGDPATFLDRSRWTV